MRSVAIALVTFLFSASAYTQESISYVCEAAKILSSPFKVNLDELHKVTQLELTMDPSGAKVFLTTEVVTAEMILNGYGATLKPVVKVEKYTLRDMRSGAMLDLVGDSANQLDLNYVILHLTQLSDDSAGPVSSGSHEAKVDLVLVSSYPGNDHANTGVLKMTFDCKMTVLGN